MQALLALTSLAPRSDARRASVGPPNPAHGINPADVYCAPAAYGDWLDSYEWTHAAILTYARAYLVGYGDRTRARVRAQPRATCSGARRVAGRSRGDARRVGAPPARALLGSAEDEGRRAGLEARHTKIEIYIPGGRWARYVGKTIGRPDTERDVGGSWVRR